MILPDINLLIHAYNSDSPLHRSAKAWWERELNGLTADIAERQYLEAREDVALQASGAYFDYFAAQVSLRNATLNAPPEEIPHGTGAELVAPLLKEGGIGAGEKAVVQGLEGNVRLA